jgi:hypothetical protein
MWLKLSANFILVFCFFYFLVSCRNNDIDPIPTPLDFGIKSLSVDNISFKNAYSNVSLQPEVIISFSEPVDQNLTKSLITLSSSGTIVSTNFTFSNSDSVVTIKPQANLGYLKTYYLTIPAELTSAAGNEFGNTASIKLVTQYDPAPKFPEIPDDELLTLVQKQTFKYFYDFAHPASGMARERNSSGDLVTSGGSGFGVMALIVGIERNFITREEGINQFDKILTFLESSDRFHGAWSHWINGNTGKVMPFSANDNGGDLVETSFLIQGLITLRQYLDETNEGEKALIDRINTLWKAVEWDWYTKGGSDVLYWHWSPDKEWIMNHQIQGYNETLITYVLAASSPTHAIPPSVYHLGFARGGGIKNGKTFYGLTLPLGEDYGGPLFFAHYSFLGLDPTNLEDDYAKYWTQNVNHSLINYSYAVANPKGYAGYSAESWGLTASDNNQKGYSAHSPTNDLGVLTPTAALSSFPYTPDESMLALKFFYYTLGDKLWGSYGFYDAFNLSEAWIANSYLAIDQGPIVIMIENYRTKLLWDLFMSAPEVQEGLTKLSFKF